MNLDAINYKNFRPENIINQIKFESAKVAASLRFFIK